MLYRLLTIRLSHLYVGLFILFYILLTIIHPLHMTSGQLALYSVNSFLFGFYFGPVVSSQKSRVADLNKAIRKEEMSILDILAQSHLLNAKDRHALKIRLRAYIDSVIYNPNVRADNQYYDELLRFTKQEKYQGNSVMDSIYREVSETQDNRDDLENLFKSKLFTHEWIVVGVLFSVTLFFAIQTDYSGSIFFRLMLAILLTGITLMMIILLKYATLTHKQAKRMWDPLRDLLKDHFEDVEESEVAPVREAVTAEA